MNRAPLSDTAPSKLPRSKTGRAPPLLAALIFPLFLLCLAPHPAHASTGNAPVGGGGSYQQLPEPDGTVGQHQEITEDHAVEQKEIADLKEQVATQQKEIEEHSKQIQILAAPHPARVYFPTDAPPTHP
jgi:hypothetical protein